MSISTVKTCLAEPPAATFLTHLATHRPAAGRVEMSFRVEMIDPLTPADQQRHAEQAALAGALLAGNSQILQAALQTNSRNLRPALPPKRQNLHPLLTNGQILQAAFQTNSQILRP